MSSKLLILDSEHRNNGSSPNKFTVSFNNSGLTNVKRVVLVGFRTINSQYNISTGVNDIFEYNYGGVDKTIVFDQMQTNVTDFILYLNGLQADFIIALDPIKKTFTFDSYGSTLTVYQNQSIDELLGITADLVDGTGSTTLYSQLLPDFSGLSIIYVSSPSLSPGNSIISNSQQSNIISHIPIKTAFGEPIVYTAQTNDSSDAVSFKTLNDINSVDIRLLDHNYKECKLNSEIHLIFKVFT